jgi:hypothetical protein
VIMSYRRSLTEEPLHVDPDRSQPGAPDRLTARERKTSL